MVPCRGVLIRNAFTIDVEEWFHVCGVDGPLSPCNWERLPSRVLETTEIVLEMLDRRSVRATFFVLGWIAERHPELVRRLLLEGHEVASHGYSHRRAYELGPTGFANDLERSLKALRCAGAGPIRGFRAPEWSINDKSRWALDLLVEHGIEFDSSMTPLRLIGNPDYPQVPHCSPTGSGTLMEFPPLVGRRMGQNIPLGGGWGLRMSSPAVVLREIEKRNRCDIPVALFIHPWELDPSPPRVSLPWGLHFAHYFKLAGFRRRLDEIIRHADFGPMGKVLQVGKA